MALIVCPECGKKVSEQALTCPGCGYPIAQLKDNEKSSVELEKISEDAETTNTETGMKNANSVRTDNKKMVAIFAAIAVIIILGIVICVGISKKQEKMKAEEIAAEYQQKKTMVMMASNLMQAATDHNLEKVNSYRTETTVGIELLENYMVELDEELAAQVLSVALFGISYDDLNDKSKQGVDDLIDYSVSKGLYGYIIHGADIVDKENGTITVEVMGYGNDYEQGLNGTALSNMEAVTKELVEGYMVKYKSAMQAYYLANGEKETVIYIIDMVIDDLVEECEKCMDDALANYDSQDECFVIKVNTVNGQWKIASIETGGVIPPATDRDTIENQAEEYQTDFMMADMIHTAILTGMIDPEVVNQDDYDDMIKKLKAGIIITNIKPSELYLMGNKSVLGTAAEILNTSDFTAYSEKIVSPTATGRIYVKAIGDAKLRVEIEGTGIVIE